MSSRQRFLIFAGTAVLVLAIIVAIILFFLYYRFVDLPGEATAEFIPSDATLYVSFNLRPGLSQIRAAEDFMSLLNTDDFLEKRDEVLEDIEENTGIHPIDDVSPWLGTNISFALLEANPDEPDAVVFVHTKNRDAALDFVDLLIEFLEDVEGADYDSRSYEGARIWEAANSSDGVIGVADDYLLIATSAATIEQMVDNLESPPAEPLAQNADFMRAQESVSSERFMFLYASADGLMEAFEDGFSPFSVLDRSFSQARRSAPDFLAASGSFVDRGFRVDLAAETPSEWFSIQTEDGLESAGAVPADTLALWSTLGIDESWAELQKSIDDDEPGQAELFQDLLEEEIDIDLESDLIGPLSGEIALALLPSDITFGNLSGDFLSGRVQTLLLLGVEEPQTIEETLGKIVQQIEDFGMQTNLVPLGDQEAVTWDLSDLGYPFSDYDPGYVVTDEWVAIGSTVDSLEEFHNAASGTADRLESDPEFSRLSDMAPDPAHGLAYFNLAGIFELVESALAGSDMADGYQENVAPFVESLNALFLGWSITEVEARGAIVLSLKE